MKITEIRGVNLEIPYPSPYRPAWQPGLVRNTRDFTLVIVRTDEGISGYGGADGHHAGNIARNVAPYLVGEEAWATERHHRVLRNAGGMCLVDGMRPASCPGSNRSSAGGQILTATGLGR